MFVCEVVTGKTYETCKKMLDITAPPAGYDSVLATGITPDRPSDFKVRQLFLLATIKDLSALIIIMIDHRNDESALFSSKTSYYYINSLHVQTLYSCGPVSQLSPESYFLF